VETHGRKNRAAVAKSVEGKTVEEVEEYADAFWKFGPKELKDWPKIMKNLEKAEARVARLNSIAEVLAWKVSEVKT
jgi:hypothetical protein